MWPPSLTGLFQTSSPEGSSTVWKGCTNARGSEDKAEDNYEGDAVEPPLGAEVAKSWGRQVARKFAGKRRNEIETRSRKERCRTTGGEVEAQGIHRGLGYNVRSPELEVLSECLFFSISIKSRDRVRVGRRWAPFSGWRNLARTTSLRAPPLCIGSRGCGPPHAFGIYGAQIRLPPTAHRWWCASEDTFVLMDAVLRRNREMSPMVVWSFHGRVGLDGSGSSDSGLWLRWIRDGVVGARMP